MTSHESKPKPTNPAPKSPADHAAGTVQEARQIWMVINMGVRGLYATQIPRMAAALAYRTIFSIIPVMAIGLLIFGSVVSDQQVEAGVRRVLTFAGISQISTVEESTIEKESREQAQTTPQESELKDARPIDEETAATHELPEPNTKPNAEPSTETADPFGGTDLEEVITDLINRVNQSIRNVPTGWIALTSGLVLFYAAMSMLIEIEKAFNQLCGAPSGRGWLKRLMLYWTILTAGSLMLAATFLAGDAFTRLVVSMAGSNSMIGAIMAGYGVSVLISTVLLLGAYLTIPNTKVKFRSALAGAFLAAVLWELGKLGFTTYLHYSTGYAKFYGSIAILPLFMLWVYLTWLIVLLGMQASFTLEHFSRLVELKFLALNEDSQSKPALLDPLVMLVIAKVVHRQFAQGQPCSVECVADEVGLDRSVVDDLLEALAHAGLIQRVYAGEEMAGWSPSRPTEQTTLRDVLESGYRVDHFRRSRASEQIPAQIGQATLDACDSMSVADLERADGQEDGSA
ncbi:MAG: YhjD/YihY/BrkB family envelope integrity protein [Phycisphaerales bacterium]